MGIDDLLGNEILGRKSGSAVELGFRGVWKLSSDGAAGIYASSYTTGQSTVQ